MIIEMKSKPYIKEIVIEHVIESDPDLSYYNEDNLTDLNEEQKTIMRYRYEHYGSHWCSYGIQARAQIYIDDINNKHVFTSHIGELQSGSIWGIESDADQMIDDYNTQQVDELKKYLSMFDIDVENIPIVIKEVSE